MIGFGATENDNSGCGYNKNVDPGELYDLFVQIFQIIATIFLIQSENDHTQKNKK